MSLLLKKSSISNKINELKANIKSQYSAGTDYDDLYHQKIASEADSEVILFTKKFVNKFTAKNILDEIHAKKRQDSDEEESICVESEPTCRIEFNINNKIELVSNSDEKTDQNENFKLEEKYIQIENESLKENQEIFVIEDEIIKQSALDNLVEQQNNSNVLKNIEIIQVKDEKKDQSAQSNEIADETDEEDDDGQLKLININLN